MNAAILDKTEFVIVLWRTGNVARTAEVLNVKPPSIYQRLRTLRKSLGFSMFNMNGRKGIGITKEGQAVIEMMVAMHNVFAYYSVRNTPPLLERKKSPSGFKPNK
jgi:hypothetical protein